MLTDRDEEAVPQTWSPDGTFLLFRKMNPPKLWLMHLPDGKASPWLQTPFLESTAAVSPDGRWIAYSMNQTGVDEIWVRPFPGPGAPTRLSDGGGARPIWKRDGKEIYFDSRGTNADSPRGLAVARVSCGDAARDVRRRIHA